MEYESKLLLNASIYRIQFQEAHQRQLELAWNDEVGGEADEAFW